MATLRRSSHSRVTRHIAKLDRVRSTISFPFNTLHPFGFLLAGNNIRLDRPAASPAVGAGWGRRRGRRPPRWWLCRRGRFRQPSNWAGPEPHPQGLPSSCWIKRKNYLSVLGIRDILVRTWIRGSVPLTNGSGSSSGTESSSRSDSFLQWLEGCKKKLFFYSFFL